MFRYCVFSISLNAKLKKICIFHLEKIYSIFPLRNKVCCSLSLGEEKLPTAKVLQLDCTVVDAPLELSEDFECTVVDAPLKLSELSEE